MSRVSPMTITSAKRDSSSYSSAVDMENVEFSSLKKYKVDKVNDVYIEIETESSEDGEEYHGGGIYYKPVISEPEWDVDSFDDRDWESDPEIRASFSDEEDYKSWRTGRIKAFQHKGFLPDQWNGIYALQDLDEPGYRNMTNREYLVSLATLCINKLNEEKGKTVELVSIVRGNISGGPRWKLYITFMAKEHPDGPLLEYQAKAMDFIEDRPPFPILCRRAPYPTIYKTKT